MIRFVMVRLYPEGLCLLVIANTGHHFRIVLECVQKFLPLTEPTDTQCVFVFAKVFEIGSTVFADEGDDLWGELHLYRT